VFVVTSAAISSERGVLTRWRMSFLAGAVTWGLAVTAMTEVLSLFRLITFTWVLSLWVGTTLVSTAICVVVCTRERLMALLRFPTISRSEVWCLGAVAVIASMVGVTALAAPPNNADSMVYHMPRVMRWVQNHTVAHYPTNYLPQILRPPWSGFAIMQFQVLTGGDRWANLVQWFSMVGSVIGVSLIARQLGSDSRGQVLAAVIVATIPMGIVQASSTQNHYVMGFWLVCFGYYVLRFMAEPRWANTLGVGASLGLAFLTKEFSYMYAAPLLVWLSLAGLRRQRWWAGPPLFVIAVIALGVNLGHYARNVDLGGTPFVIAGDDRQAVNAAFGVRATVSNVIRNASVHVGTPSGRVNRWLYEGVRLLHAPLRIDVSDPRTTDAGDRGFYQRPFSKDEDSAGNPIHLALMLAGIVLLLVRRKQREATDVALYAVALVIAFLILCSFVNWQPWHSRLHLPLFILWSPLTSLLLLKNTSYKRALSIAVLLITTSTLYVFGNPLRPLLGFGPNSTVFNTNRVDQIFKQFDTVKDAYLTAVQLVATTGCSEIGLDTGLEYPVWVLLQKMERQPFRIEHVNVSNISAAKKMATPFEPCAVIADWNCSPPCPVRDRYKAEAILEGSMLRKAWSSGRVGVFIKLEREKSVDSPQ
jgi:4-amino-4-deoxy-L-arabinose transferase-like glycosyltransferase